MISTKAIVPQEHAELYREIELMSKLEHFCDGCDYLEEFKDYEEWGSATVYRCSEFSCKWDMCPDDDDCPRHDEYEELREEYDAMQACDDLDDNEWEEARDDH